MPLRETYLSNIVVTSDYLLLCYDTVYVPTYSKIKPVIFIEGALSSTTGTDIDTATRFAVMFDTEENYNRLVRRNKMRFPQPQTLRTLTSFTKENRFRSISIKYCRTLCIYSKEKVHTIR